MNQRRLARMGAVIAAVGLVAGCTSGEDPATTPELVDRGTVLTTVQPTRQDLNNKISLSGKVTINPVFGIVAPTGGEVRYRQFKPSTSPDDEPVWVATIWEDGHPKEVTIPANSTMAGRLLEDKALVTEGMPIVSARHAGYGIVAEIDSAQAYRISGAVKSVQAQIKNGPGPFKCKARGTIAALPAGTVPEPPPTTAPATDPSSPAEIVDKEQVESGPGGSEETGLRLVCTAPKNVKLINGAAVTLDVVTDNAKNALVLPVEAVAGTQGKGKVDIVGEDKTRKTVDVELGLTDGKVVQIKKGLTGDETVAVPGPNLPEAKAEPGAPG
ncbi:efflux RND transporter periplasmic adaptor subunit [Actinoplanes sp. NPDC051861]|uniref:efflux RND transporter periplasmic adaptor subunit n=1 Tax=Actinoplanes sp. NPDC051861 TaxID=3155170 RepID=UPI00341AAB88